MASTQNRFSVLKQAHEAITRTSKPKKHYLALKMSINILSLHFLELKCSIIPFIQSTPCLKKNRTSITFWDNSNKLCLIIIMISWENHQKVLNIVVCYGLTIFYKTGYQLMKDVDELKQRLVAVWSGLRQTVVDDAIDEWKRRLRACVRVKGQHFEHLL